MPKFIECEHRKLKGRTVLMATPRNGWKPIKKSSRSQAEPGGAAASAASTTPQEQE